MTELDTAERILGFIDAWARFTHHDDHIAGLKGHGYDGELLCSDLRALVEDRDRLRAACQQALKAIAPCVVGWDYADVPLMPEWAKRLESVVPILRTALGLAALEGRDG